MAISCRDAATADTPDPSCPPLRGPCVFALRAGEHAAATALIAPAWRGGLAGRAGVSPCLCCPALLDFGERGLVSPAMRASYLFCDSSALFFQYVFCGSRRLTRAPAALEMVEDQPALSGFLVST